MLNLFEKLRKNIWRSHSGLTIFLAILVLGVSKSFCLESVQVHQDFSTDPGWEGINNRIVASPLPVVHQDFGWSRTNYLNTSQGEIGGTIYQSRTPAWYAMPFGRPLTFDNAISAYGKIAVMPSEKDRLKSAAYIGFFNSARQGWRPWSSMAIRITRQYSQEVTFGIDSMSALWNGHGYETDIIVPADGKVHSWSFTYDPNAIPPKEWPDPQLKSYLTHNRQTAAEIFEKARKAEPNVTSEQIQARLREALAMGFIAYLPRQKGDFYTLLGDYENRKGLVSIQIDNGREYRDWLPIWLRNAPVSMDRFGIFNMQIYHSMIQLYVADLTVNGKKVNLTENPNWEGRGNRFQFLEEDFQRQNFGYSETNWAGARAGEIGGVFYRTEPNDSLHGYYADDIGKLTLEDPISFSGSICFVDGETDAGMFFGYFNSQDYLRDLPASQSGMPLENMMGIVVEGPTRVGYRFSALCSPTPEMASQKNGPVLLPTAERHAFSFTYDPIANKGIGRIAVVLDGQRFELDLSSKQRVAGAIVDRFGVASIRKGGKCVTLYLDDLTYTAYRPEVYNPVHHQQQVITVPYPSGGRGVY
jgi:hypothetical protein